MASLFGAPCSAIITLTADELEFRASGLTVQTEIFSLSGTPLQLNT